MEQIEREKVEKLKASLPDIQKTRDDRGISIDRVGVENVDFQLNILGKDGSRTAVQTKVDMFCSLRHSAKGCNMSRFLEVLMAWKDEVLTDAGINNLLKNLQEKMGPDAVDAYIKIKFKYFLPKISPVSKEKSFMAYDCIFTGMVKNNRFTFTIGVEVITTSNCPCSREISEYGAHGQRSNCRIIIEKVWGKTFWLEDLIPLVESQGSCEIFPLLKRVDEKYVTERAYKNPKFVEDTSRDIAKALQATGLVKRFKIEVRNNESIHTHDATAILARKLRGSKWVPDDRPLRN